jgi:hypothetical protein
MLREVIVFRLSKLLLAIASLFFTSMLAMASISSSEVEKELGLLSNQAILYGFLGSKLVR